MRRAARGDVEIGGKLGHFAWQFQETAILRRLLLHRAAHLVAAREAVDAVAALREPREPKREILEFIDDHVDDLVFLLHQASDRHITRAEHDRAHALECARPHYRIGRRSRPRWS